MFAIAPTDIGWFTFLKENEYNSFVNFWTPTPWNIKGLAPGDRWYLLLKSPIRKLAGYGEFYEYQNLTAQAAWDKFGFRNGVETKTKFIEKIQSYIDKNSKVHGNVPIDISTYKIGCLTLFNCEYWEELDYKTPEDFNVSFAKQIVTFKKYNGPLELKYTPYHNFSLVNEPRENYKGLSNKRRGPGNFKSTLLKAYNNRCCITGEDCPELLQAAHIQDYLTVDSNHVQNGLLLRIDLHKLYDNHLLFIDSDYKIHISTFVASDFYRSLNGNTIVIPANIADQPSKEALELRREFFRK